jgi:hypothetical protein
VLSNDADASVVGGGSLKDSKSDPDAGTDETEEVALGPDSDLVWGEPVPGRSGAD